MGYSLTWLPAVLKAAGCKVVEQPGWETRGHGDVGTIKGILCHHTAGGKTGNAPSLRVVQDGRPDLAGPLSQLVLGRDGTFYVVAAGKCWHAGAGNWQGITDGNSNMIGIEAENTGLTDDPWPTVQKEAYAKGVAAIASHLKLPYTSVAGHREYALPKGRKPDPSFNMNDFREYVRDLMNDSPVKVPADAPKRPVTAAQRDKMAEAIMKSEARLDSKGNLMVYHPPAGDGGGAYEVAGITVNHHPEMAAKLKGLVEAGKQVEAKKVLKDYYLDYTKDAAQWTDDAGVEYQLRDSALHRGPTGAAKILQMALNVTPVDGKVGPQTRAAMLKYTPKELVQRIRDAREEYEREVIGYRPQFWAGFINRWNKSQVLANQLSEEQARSPLLAPEITTGVTAVVVGGGGAAVAAAKGAEWPAIAGILIFAVVGAFLIYKLLTRSK